MLRIYSRFLFSKIYKCPKEALSGLTHGNSLLVGGFGVAGIPMNLINAIKQLNIKDLTVVSNDCGVGQLDPTKDQGLSILLRNKQIKRMVASYIGENHQLEKEYLKGQIQVELIPQGTLAEKIRSGGAGIPAFYTATGYQTFVNTGMLPIKYKPGGKQVQIYAKPKQVKTFHGQNFILEESIKGDFAIIKAYKADKDGNLTFRKTARNFNQDMATAAKCVIAEVEEIVEPGQIDPDQVHVPGVYVDRIFKIDPNNLNSKKLITKLKYSDDHPAQEVKKIDVRGRIAERVAKQVHSGMIINLGIGIPTLLPHYLPPGLKIKLHSENGLLGIGDYPKRGQEDADLINAGKETITTIPGASFFSSSNSFALIRGGHLDLTVLGALQVSQTGDIANWFIPGKMLKGMGGAMDLVACRSKVIVAMEHTSKGAIKLLQKCSLPLTAQGVVNMVITDKAVFENQGGRLILIEIAKGSTLQQVQAITGFKLQLRNQLKYF